MKKVISVLLSIFIMVSMSGVFPSAVFAAEEGGACGENMKWSLDPSTGALILSGSGTMYDYGDGNAPWLSYKAQIKSVVCQSGVESIGSNAFSGYTAITSVDFGDSLKSIGEYAFSGCSAITGVKIPDSVISAGQHSFENCTSVEWINISSQLTEIPAYMFSGCNNSAFWWVSVPKSVTVIGEYAFYNCSGLNWNTIAGKGIRFGTDCFKNVRSDSTFIIADKATKDYLSTYRQNFTYKCVDDNHTSSSLSVTDPTCTEQGFFTATCDICGESFKGGYVDALGHDYNPTMINTADYYYYYNCNRCGINAAISAITLKDHFQPHINAVAGESNFSSEFDINEDGVINARDFSLICMHIKNFNESNHKTTLDTSAAYQTMKGFGASAAWWAQFVGGWDDAKVNEIMGLLYDKENGAGLNIYRYNLGAGSENDSNITYPDRGAECFLNSDGTYNWNADANAQKCLAAAKNAYGNDLRVTLFCNSAPVYYTKNSKAYRSYYTGSSLFKTGNLSSSNYDKFADFVVTCAEHFTDEGYRITNISPINEPEWDWMADSNGLAGQEGSYYTPSECRDIYKRFIARISSSSVNDTCKIEMWESGQMYGNKTTFKDYLEQMLGVGSTSYTENRYDNKELRAYFDAVSFHSYWVDQSEREKTAELLNGSTYQKYGRALTEYCQMDGSSSGLGIDKGLELADTMWQDLTILNAEEWDWWVAVARGGYMDGLVYIDYVDNPDGDVVTAKRLWVMGNFAKYTKEGSVRVEASCNINGVKVCAFDNQDETVTLVYINTTNNDEMTAVDSSVYSSFSTYVTDADRNLEVNQNAESAENKVIIPANSVTTVVAVKA